MGGLYRGLGDLERELVVADADPIVIGQRRRAPNTCIVYVDTVGRSQIGDHETCTSVDDDGVVAADIGVFEHDVVVGEPADAGGGGVNRYSPPFVEQQSAATTKC